MLIAGSFQMFGKFNFGVELLNFLQKGVTQLVLIHGLPVIEWQYYTTLRATLIGDIPNLFEERMRDCLVN